MSDIKVNPEDVIIEAAERVFLRKGVDGTTMSMIAEEANISRTSLNYYYRRKEQLFEKVIDKIITVKVIPSLSKLIDLEIPIIEKIKIYINEYVDLVLTNPLLPVFVIVEMQREPKHIIDLFKKMNLNISKLKSQINDEVKQGKIRPFKLEDLYANVMGMVVFPVMSKPVFMNYIFNENDNEFREFIGRRKEVVSEVIENWLVPK